MVAYAELVLAADTSGLLKAQRDLKGVRNEGARTERGVEKSMGGVAKSADGVKQGFAGAARAAGALAAAVGVGSALSKAIQDARGFSRGLAEVSTLIAGTPEQMDALASSSKELAATFGTTSQNQVEAFYQAISAGAGGVEEATAVLDAANRFAVGGVTNVTTGVDALTTAMNAYAATGLTAAEASDALFVGIKGGKTTADELAASLGNIVPIASAAGVSFDEVVAATAALTTQGLGTSEAVTGLRQTLSGIIKPTSEAAKEAERLGIAFSSEALADKGLSAFLEEVIVKTGGSQESMAQLFGSVEALNAVLSMAGGGGEAFNEILSDMEAKAGATAAAYEKMADSADNRLSVATSQMSVALLEIGEAVLPMLVPVVQSVAAAVVALSSNMNELGPIIGGAAVAFAAFVAPVTALGVAFGAAAVLIVNNWDAIKSAFANGVAHFDQIRTSAFSALMDFGFTIATALDQAVATFSGFGSAAYDALVGGLGYIKNFASDVVAAIETMGRDAIAAAQEIGGFIVDGIKQGISSKWADLKGYVAGLGTGMLDGIKDKLGIRSPSREFMEVGRYSMEGLQIGLETNSDLITDAIGSITDYMLDGFKGGLDGLKDILLNSLKDMAKIALKNPIQMAFGVVGSASSAAAGQVGGAPGGGLINGLLGKSLGGLLGTWGGTGGILGGLSGVVGGFTSGGIGGGIAAIGKGLSGIASGIGGFGGAIGAALPVLGAVTAAISFFKKKVTELDRGINFAAENMAVSIDGYKKINTKRFWGLSSKDSEEAFDGYDEGIPAMAQAVNDVQAGIMDAAAALGVGADAFEGFSYSFQSSFKDMTDEQIQAELSAKFAQLGHDFAILIPGLEGLTENGALASDTLYALIGSLNAVNESLYLFDRAALDMSLSGAAAANELIALSGGLDQFAAKTEFVFASMLTTTAQQARLTEIAIEEMNSTLGSLGIAVPETHAEFMAMLNAQDLMTEGGRNTHAALLDVAAAFVQVNGTAQDAADAISAVSGDLSQAYAAAALSSMQAMGEAAQNAYSISVDGQIDALTSGFDDLSDTLSDQISLATDAVRSAQGVLDALTGAIDDRKPDESATQTQARTVAAVGALTRAVERGILPEAEVLDRILSDISDTPEAFKTREDYLKDFYRTNAILAEAQGMAEVTLSIEEQMLAALNDQLAQAEAQNNSLILKLQEQLAAIQSLPAALSGIMPTGELSADALNAMYTAIDAMQFTGLSADINDLFLSVLDRNADIVGLNKYIEEVTTGSLTLTGVADALRNSVEGILGYIPGFEDEQTNLLLDKIQAQIDVDQERGTALLSQLASQHGDNISLISQQLTALLSLPASLAGIMPTGTISESGGNALFTDQDTSSLTGISAQINSLYNSALGRNADLEGLNYYIDLINNQGFSLSQVGDLLAGSTEALTGVTPGFSVGAGVTSAVTQAQANTTTSAQAAIIAAREAVTGFNYTNQVGSQSPFGRIPGFKNGTKSAPGGLAYVHKDELINLPRGSQVHTSQNTRSLLDQSELIAEVRELRRELSQMRSDNNRGHAETAREIDRNGRPLRKWDVTGLPAERTPA